MCIVVQQQGWADVDQRIFEHYSTAKCKEEKERLREHRNLYNMTPLISDVVVFIELNESPIHNTQKYPATAAKLCDLQKPSNNGRQTMSCLKLYSIFLDHSVCISVRPSYLTLYRLSLPTISPSLRHPLFAPVLSSTSQSFLSSGSFRELMLVDRSGNSDMSATSLSLTVRSYHTTVTATKLMKSNMTQCFLQQYAHFLEISDKRHTYIFPITAAEWNCQRSSIC